LTIQIIRLKIILIVFTTIKLGYISLIFIDSNLFFNLIEFYSFNIILLVLHTIVVNLFLKFLWKDYPENKKYKTNKTSMILFLGLIGLWIWLSNKKELENLNFNKI
jgi:hypothetical protein